MRTVAPRVAFEPLGQFVGHSERLLRQIHTPLGRIPLFVIGPRASTSGRCERGGRPFARVCDRCIDREKRWGHSIDPP